MENNTVYKLYRGGHYGNICHIDTRCIRKATNSNLKHETLKIAVYYP